MRSALSKNVMSPRTESRSSRVEELQREVDAMEAKLHEAKMDNVAVKQVNKTTQEM